MNTRIKQLRKSLKLNQESFGSRLGVTGGAISRIESGNNKLTEQMIKVICSEFNVDENWLRTGVGNIFVVDEDKELETYILDLANGDVLKKNLVKAICKLSDSEWDVLKKILKELTPNQ